MERNRQGIRQKSLFNRNPYRVKRKKSILRNGVFWLSILSVMIIAGFLYLFCSSDFFQTKEIKISGNSKASGEEIERIIKENLNEKILFFSTENIFLLNSKRINQEILKKFPQISDLKIRKKFWGILSVSVTERMAIAVICQNIEEENKNCFFVDKEGVVFEPIVNAVNEGKQKLLGNHLNLPELKMSSPTDIFLGKKVLWKERLSDLFKTESALKNINVIIREIKIISNDRVDFQTEEGWQIFFNSEKDMQRQMTKLKTILEKEIPAEKRTGLEYIDLRFGNFAPYKYRSL
ncbi:MAG: hypothetical protein COZ91_01740 [Candidatus Nealsonbacteria bacterium CG_4_8_14_3_um_filter_39_7]|uniref:POTRA domain-containing protein n=1 Tax=Candidatus Nealsonbacteria bacterium CG23_combo_of_CG06-09_8_20_14_all_39_17 TaxID=1974722 RepID=A0A2G9YV51_9BACT|nr:MAG: hypothetical protein COX37_00335 [Candidatus Nealsonbacteria bacterium CG23_combo_of_CG06-09_8_20_14_all_39_17]PIU43990.1 MAG: hypothetical protein COS96_01445 [Candidatus Nealsonbacteria bacterium CG07_land_8_20_14_0_80_39_13]PIW91197.1 MAG: hypothetical protein COZ91_01740 [Candidatus Nealsonbacteria bacterium CG_4_8_14_3_um_filter_39_7]